MIDLVTPLTRRQGRQQRRARRARSVLGALLFCLLALAAPLARANGRFPYAQQLREPAPGSVIVAGTYGLLLSVNAGRDFQFVCESSLFGKTLQGSWLDPLLEALPDGTLVSGSRSGLRVSRDRGCTFQSEWSLPFDPTFLTPDPAATGGNGSLIDLCPSHLIASGVLALATSYAADNNPLEHRLYQSGDGAKTWAKLGSAIPTSLARVVLTLEAAPSKPARIYVSGSSSQGHQLLVTDDDGATWAAHPITLSDSAGVSGVYIGAVSPSDPDRVYLRVNRESETDDGSTTWDDSLLVSEDGGQSFREVLRHQASLLGFALSADGNTVAAGYGDPEIAPIIVADAELGLYGASASELNFTQRVAALAVSCLRWTASGLYACAKESDPLGIDTSGTPDFHVAVFKGSGLPQKIADFTGLLKLKDVRGPMPWADNHPSGCMSEWSSGDPQNPGTPSVCQNFNACTRGAATPLSDGAIVCGAVASGGAGGNASAGNPSVGGSTASGGTASAGAATQAGSAGSTPSPGNEESGCGYRIRSRSDHQLVLWCALAIALCGWAARRRALT